MNGRLLLSSSLSSSKLGYWNPFLLCGNDTILGSYIFDLDSLPFLFLPGWLATGVVMWLQRFIAGYFTFRLLRETLRLDSYSSIYAGLAYSLLATYPFSGFQFGFPMYYGLSIPGISFFIWALSRLNENRKFSYIIAFCVGALFSLTTNVAFGFFILPVIIFWFLFVIPRLNLKFWLMVLIFMMGFLIFELPLLWAISYNAPLSHRAYLTLTNPSGQYYIKDLFMRDRILLAIAVMGLIASRFRYRPLFAFVVAIVFSLVFVIYIYPLFSIFIQPHLGFLRGFQFDRIYLMYPYLTIMSAAIGISCLRGWQYDLVIKPSVSYRVSVYTVVLVIVIGMVGWQALSMKSETLPMMLKGANYKTVYQNPALRQLAEINKASPPFRVVNIPDPSTEYPYHLYPNAASVNGLESADGYVGVYFHRYQEYWEQVIGRLFKSDPNRVYLLKGDYDLKLLSLANVRFIISDHLLQDKNLQLLPLGSSNRDEPIAWQIRFAQNPLKAAIDRWRFPDYSTFIYENPHVFQRFFLVGKVRLFKESKQVLEALRHADYADLSSTAYMKQDDVAMLSFEKMSAQNGHIKLQSYTSDLINLKVTNQQNSILIITNNFNPYWKATVDGIETKVFPVDHTFQGIYVRSGEHEVILEYDPPYAIRGSFKIFSQ